MILDIFLEAILSSVSLPARISRILVAAAMLVAGTAFLTLSVLMAISAVRSQARGGLFFACVFLTLSSGSFWLMYRAARGVRESHREGA
jgi:ABC-type uncharacterized transport system permease subunit